MQATELLLEFGKISPFLAVIIGIFFWQNQRTDARQKAFEERLEGKEERFYQLNEKTTTAINNNTLALNNLSEIVKERSKK